MLKQDALTELIPLCAAEDIAVIPYQIYQGGLLTGKYQRAAWNPRRAPARKKSPRGLLRRTTRSMISWRQSKQAQNCAASSQMSAYALRWTLEQPAVVSAIVGVKSEKQLDDAVAAVG